MPKPSRQARKGDFVERTTMHIRREIRNQCELLLPAVYTMTRLRGSLHVSFQCPEKAEDGIICQTVCASSLMYSEKVVMNLCPEAIIM